MTSEYQPGSHPPEGYPSPESELPESSEADLEAHLGSSRDTNTELVADYGDTNEAPSSYEPASAEELSVYIDRLEAEYRERLAGQFASWLGDLDTGAKAFILADEELRNNTAHAIQELGLDSYALDFGKYIETAYAAKSPEIAMRAMEVNARAVQANQVFQEYAADIAQATGSLHIPGPVKTANRIAEKMEKEYRSALGGAGANLDLLASMVKDAARCRIVVNGDPTVADQAVIDKIEESGLTIAEDSLHHLLIKRGFHNAYTGEPIGIESGTSYQDTKVTVTVTVEVPTRDGGTTLCEIAIVTPEMVAATVSEHPIYEITRSLQGDDRSEAAKLSYSLGMVQEAFFSGVSRQINQRVSAT